MSLWRKSVGYAVGRGIASAMVFLLLPILTRLMSPQQFGEWQALAFWAAIVTVVVQLGADQALFKFYILDAQRSAKFLFAAFAVVFSSSVVVLIFCWFLREFFAVLILADAQKGILVFLTALWGVSDGTFFMLASLFQAQERVKMFVVADVMRAALGYGGAILLLMNGLGTSGVISAWAAAGFVAFVLFTPVIIRQCQTAFERKIFSSMLHYGLPLALNMLAVKVFSFSDRWLLARLDTFSSAGAYSAAMKIAGIVAMAIIPIRYAWVARMFNMKRNGTLREKMPTIWRQLTAVIAIVSIVVILLSREIFNIMIGPGYEAGIYVIPILSAVYFLDGIILIADAGIYVSGKTVFVPIFTAFSAVVNIALNILLIPSYGVMGAALSALVAYSTLLFLAWRMGQFLMPVKIPYPKVFLSMFAVFAAVFTALTVRSLLMRLIAIIALTIAVLFIASLDRDVLRLLTNRKKFLKDEQ